jgi:hypothetical protein
MNALRLGAGAGDGDPISSTICQPTVRHLRTRPVARTDHEDAERVNAVHGPTSSQDSVSLPDETGLHIRFLREGWAG